GHLSLCNKRPLARSEHFGVGHPRSAQRRINIERVALDTVANAPAIIIKQIAGNDLIIVVRSMCKGSLTVAVSQSPDSRHAGTQLIVDNDVSPLVALNAGFGEAQVVCIRAASDCQQNMCPDQLGISLLTVGLHTNASCNLFETDALCI